MLKIILSSAVLAASLFAGPINWHSAQDMEQDFKAKKIDKPILYFVGASTCNYCKQEKIDMESNDKYSDFVNKEYYNVYVNMDQEPILDYMEVNITPTIYLLNPENKGPLTPSPAEGAVPSDRLLSYFKKVTEAYNYYLQQNKK